MRRILVFVSLVFWFALGACADSPPPLQAPGALALKDCINIAIAQNLDLKAAEATVQIFDARVVEAHAPLLPSLASFYDWTRQLSPLGPPVHASFGTFRAQPLLLNTYKDGLTLNQLIYDGRRTASFFHGAQAARSAQAAVYSRLIQTIAYNTMRAYYQVLADQKMVGVAVEDLKNSEEHLKEAKANFKAGTAARADVVFAEVPVATARLNLTQARSAEQEAEASLDRLLSFDVSTRLDLKDELTETPYSITLEEASKEALQDRDEIKQARSLVQSAEAQLAAADGGYWPRIGAFADYGWTDYGSNIIPGNLGYSYGLQATFDIYTGGLRRGEVDEGKATLRQNKALLESAKENALLDVKSAYLNFDSARESISEARTELNEANENLDVVEGQYKVGVAPILNLLDAEVKKIQAEQHLINALANYDIAIGQLEYAIGR